MVSKLRSQAYDHHIASFDSLRAEPKQHPDAGTTYVLIVRRSLTCELNQVIQ